MYRVRIDLPHQDRQTLITSRDQVKNIIDNNFRKHGIIFDRNQPARYGFGVIAKPVTVSANLRMHRVERVVIGSSDPLYATALSKFSTDDLIEPNAVPGAGLDLRSALIIPDPSPVAGEAVALYSVSPIRVLRGKPSQSILELGPEFEAAINQTMARRFRRSFHLRFIPDSFYVRLKNGDIVARMAIKVKSDGYVVAYPGLVLPFVLAGPVEDLHTVWYSGIGSSTAMGFGCVEVSQ